MFSLLIVCILMAGAYSQAIDPNCLDKLPDCEKYGLDTCTKFQAWAKDNCENFCKICNGPTKAPPPCRNVLTNCDQYGKASCTNPTYKSWAEEKCRYFCRLCSASELARLDAIVTTLPPSACMDKVNCREYTKASCSGQYTHWAKENCPVFCGICSGGVTPAPACIDAIPNCNTYGTKVCQDSHYTLWVEDNCRKYCGKCGGGACVDKLNNCDLFPESSCKPPYEEWAKQNCNNTCKFCIGKPKPSPPCQDNIADCELYGKETCAKTEYKHWAETKCRYFCRKCTPFQLAAADGRTTTIPPALCKDKLDCRLYGADTCKGNYKQWAKTNCMLTCGFCKGLPTTPLPCVDKIPNCSTYSPSTCTDEKYVIWAHDHCYKFCGFCGNGGPVKTPPPIVHVTSGHRPPTPPNLHIIRTPPMPGK